MIGVALFAAAASQAPSFPVVSKQPSEIIRVERVDSQNMLRESLVLRGTGSAHKEALVFVSERPAQSAQVKSTGSTTCPALERHLANTSEIKKFAPAYPAKPGEVIISSDGWRYRVLTKVPSKDMDERSVVNESSPTALWAASAFKEAAKCGLIS
jgi:hypothetical protein